MTINKILILKYHHQQQQQVIESEVKTHAALVKDLGKRASAIQQNDESSAKEVSSKQVVL